MNDDGDVVRRAIDYALSAVDAVTPDLLSRPTPCAKWSLRMLLEHACESVAALEEGLEAGRVGLFPAADDEPLGDPIQLLRLRLTRLRDSWSATSEQRIVAVADQQMPLSLLAGAAALEIAAHAWDIFQTSGPALPIPPGLAAELLARAPQLLPEDARHRLFAPPVSASEPDEAGDELLALLGRSPADAAITRTEST